MAAAAILDFGNFKVLTVGTVKRVELHQHAKFRHFFQCCRPKIYNSLSPPPAFRTYTRQQTSVQRQYIYSGRTVLAKLSYFSVFTPTFSCDNIRSFLLAVGLQEITFDVLFHF